MRSSVWADHGCLGAKGAHSWTFFLVRIGLLLPESNLHLRAAGCRALPARPAPGSKGVSATWFPAVFAGDFVWGRGARGLIADMRVGDASCQQRESRGRQNRGRAARARRELRCAPVRPGSIEAPAPSAALCEATTSAARSTPSLGVKTAVFSPPQEPADEFGPVSGTSVAHALAAGGTSAHLAATRGCGPTQTGDRARPDRGAAQLPPRTGGTTTLSTHHPNLVG